MFNSNSIYLISATTKTLVASFAAITSAIRTTTTPLGYTFHI